MVLSTIIWLLVFLFIGLIAAMLVSPLESLSWWAGWQDEDTVVDELQESVEEAEETYEDASEGGVTEPSFERYIVYLTGIGGFSEDEILDEEVRLLSKVNAHLENVKLITDVYPYSASQRGLTDHNRLFSWLWRLAVARKVEGRPLGLLVNFRNVLQVLVAADRRYGVVFGRGTSEAIIQALSRHHYPFESGTPVTLLGYSGGGEVAVSVAQNLRVSLSAPITIVSLAGVFSADRGLSHVDRMIHIYGSKDFVQQMGAIFFPRRWRVMIWSQFNQLRKEGRVKGVNIGKLTHNGPGSYTDYETLYSDGVTLLDYSAEQIAISIRDVAKPLQTPEN